MYSVSVIEVFFRLQRYNFFQIRKYNQRFLDKSRKTIDKKICTLDADFDEFLLFRNMQKYCVVVQPICTTNINRAKKRNASPILGLIPLILRASIFSMRISTR